MHLIAKRPTHIDIAGRRAMFAAGEGIWTESSYKFTHRTLTQMGAGAGLSLAHLWTDRRGWFSLALFVPHKSTPAVPSN
jgi:uncharacterized SAM-dependent methyltransferase